MKKIIITLLLLATAMAARALSFWQPAPTGQMIYYTVISGTSTVRVANPEWDDNTPPTGTLVLPATVTNNGTTYSVVSLGIEAFRGCTGLTKVVIPEGVTSIGRMAFYGCSALDTIELPTSLTEIMSQAFAGTAYLRNADNRNSQGMIYIGQWLVAGYTSSLHVAQAVVDDGTRGLAAMAFYFDTALRQLTLPESLLYISDLAFEECNGLDTLRCRAVAPPQLSDNAFGQPTTVVVPCGSVAAYMAAPSWSQHNIVEDTCHVSIAEAVAAVGPVAVVDEMGVTVSNAEGCNVVVTDIMGRRIAAFTAGRNQHVTLPATGIYLVAVDGQRPLKVCYCK